MVSMTELKIDSAPPNTSTQIELAGAFLRNPNMLGNFAQIIKNFPFSEGTKFGAISDPEKLIARGYTPEQLSNVLLRLDGELKQGKDHLFDQSHWQLASLEAIEAMSGPLDESVQQALDQQTQLLRETVARQHIGFTPSLSVLHRQPVEGIILNDNTGVWQEIGHDLAEALVEGVSAFGRVQKNPKVVATEILAAAIAACGGVRGGVAPFTKVTE
jgi:hypothetical protein